MRCVRQGELGVRLALVHGSALRGPRARDVVVFVDEGLDEIALRVMVAVEECTGLEADMYVVGDVASANCFLVLEALRNGAVAYRDVGGAGRLILAVNM